MAAIDIGKVSKTFTDQQRKQRVLAFGTIDLAVRDKDLLYLLGPSGSWPGRWGIPIRDSAAVTLSRRLMMAGYLIERLASFGRLFA